MTIAQVFAAELQHEGPNTRKMLEAIPEAQFDYKPHEKSMTIKALAIHIAEMFGYIKDTLENDEIDLAAYNYQPPLIDSTDDLLKLFDEKLNAAMLSLENYPDEKMFVEWTLRRGDDVVMQVPRTSAIRGGTLNHAYHHRGQLSTYLRAAGAKVPGIYGPTADDQPPA